MLTRVEARRILGRSEPPDYGERQYLQLSFAFALRASPPNCSNLLRERAASPGTSLRRALHGGPEPPATESATAVSTRPLPPPAAPCSLRPQEQATAVMDTFVNPFPVAMPPVLDYSKQAIVGLLPSPRQQEELTISSYSKSQARGSQERRPSTSARPTHTSRASTRIPAFLRRRMGASTLGSRPRGTSSALGEGFGTPQRGTGRRSTRG